MFQVKEYNAETGLLTGVKDSLTQKELTFAYDDDRQLIGITRPNGVNTTYNYDESGKLIRIQDGTVIDLKYSFDKSGQLIGADMTVPLDPETLLVKQGSKFDYNDASQVSSTGYVYDKRGRLTTSPDRQYSWDGASRLIKIGDVNLAYNGLDDLLTRNGGTSSIRYFYNYALGLNPVMAEKNESGSFLRYYVWMPGGQLLYMIDAENGNKAYYYHFDHAGSTLALSDGSGTVTDKYAYLPYGELLKHEGANPQSFTFIGKFGVRQESPTLYQMRARYYDAKTGRFLSGDPVWPRIAAPMEINPYIYAAANPTGWIDPTGLAGYWLNDPWLNNPLSVALARRAMADYLASQVTDTAGDTGGFTGDRETTPTNTQDVSDAIGRTGIELGNSAVNTVTSRPFVEGISAVLGVAEKVFNYGGSVVSALTPLAAYHPWVQTAATVVSVGLNIERATTLSDPAENAKRVGEDSERILISPGRWGNAIGEAIGNLWYKDDDEYLRTPPDQRDQLLRNRQSEHEERGRATEENTNRHWR